MFVKRAILSDLQNQIAAGTIGFLPWTVPVEITPQHVVLALTRDGARAEGEPLLHETDFVLLCTGFEADLNLFESAGVTLQSPERVPVYDPETMETDVPGLYVAGTAASGNRVRYNLFIENCHQHVSKIVTALTGSCPYPLGTIAGRDYDLPLDRIRAN